MYGVKPACLCALLPRGAAVRDCGAVAPRPVRPGGQRPPNPCTRGVSVGLEDPGHVTALCKHEPMECLGFGRRDSGAGGVLVFVLRGAGVCRPGGLVLRDLPPMVGRTSGHASPARIISGAFTPSHIAVLTASLLEHVIALSSAPPAIGGPGWVALAAGTFGDPLRGQGPGRRSHWGGAPRGPLRTSQIVRASSTGNAILRRQLAA